MHFDKVTLDKVITVEEILRAQDLSLLALEQLDQELPAFFESHTHQYSEESVGDVIKEKSINFAKNATYKGVDLIGSTVRKGVGALKGALSSWKEEREIKREAMMRYFSQRTSLTNVILSRLYGIERELKNSDMYEKRKVATSMFKPFAKDTELPYPLTHSIDGDEVTLTKDYGLLLKEIKAETEVLEKLAKNFNANSDAEFERTFMDEVAKLKPYAIHNTFPVVPTHYLGNSGVNSNAVTSPEQLSGKGDEFISAYVKTRRYHFMSHRTNFNAVPDDILLDRDEVLGMVKSALKLLAALRGSEKILTQGHQRLTEAQLTTYGKLVETNPAESLERYRLTAMEIDRVIEVPISHIERIAEPMYIHMQRKAMAILHIAARWQNAKSATE